MVSCRSCGRNIASGTTIRCSKCSAPFHLSCSHRYSISADGVFSLCCAPSAYQIRTRNKRRLQQTNVTNKRNQQNFNQTGDVDSGLQEEGMRYGKIQKVEIMGVNDQPISDSGNTCEEVCIIQTISCYICFHLLHFIIMTDTT